MRDCQTADDRLFAFVDGIEPDLETHVASCDECQDFLAELWIGELQTDLAEPVLKQIRFDEFLREVGQLAMDIAGAMGRAVAEYGPRTERGRLDDFDPVDVFDPADDSDVDQAPDTTGSRSNEDDEE